MTYTRIDPLDKNKLLSLVNQYVAVENLPHRLNIEATLRALGLNQDYYSWVELSYKCAIANKPPTK